MNLLLISPKQVDATGVFHVSGRHAAHLIDVLHVTIGQQVRAGIENGQSGLATVVELSGDVVTLRFDLNIFEALKADRTFIDLVVAIPRPKAVSRLLFSLASLGVRRVDLVNAWKVDKSYLASPKLSADAISRELILGAEQGGQTRIPQVETHRLFRQFAWATLKDRLLKEHPLAFVCHPHNAPWIEDTWARALAQQRTVASGAEERSPPRVCIAIGPEGGWTDRELGTFDQLGFNIVRIANGILRVDGACISALAQVELLLRQSRLATVAAR